MASLCILLPTVTIIVQEILLLYMLWECYSNAVAKSTLSQSAVKDSMGDNVIAPAFLTHVFLCMCKKPLKDLACPTSAQPMAVNKRLERTQAVG
jgi:hypothetical protein